MSTPDDRRCIFIVGSSRSGTTMMGRILDRHPEVYMFHELHFFEQMWSPASDEQRFSGKGGAIDLASRLLYLERGAGYLAHGDPSGFREEARKSLVEGRSVEESTPFDIYRDFLFQEASHNGASIPCEQTPRNLFYLGEILGRFPGARVVNMVRDPRDVLLSQKRKWKRHFLGASNIPLTEAFRSWVNYHPITISRLWAASVRAARPFRDHPRVRTVHFEDVLETPERVVQEVCEFADIEFQDQMLEVRQIGSSNEEDRPDQRGIDSDRSGSWQEGGLSDTELFLCQKIVGDLLDGLPYTLADVRPNPLALPLSLLAFPVKTGSAFLLNLPRMNNVFDTLRRRLQ